MCRVTAIVNFDNDSLFGQSVSQSFSRGTAQPKLCYKKLKIAEQNNAEEMFWVCLTEFASFIPHFPIFWILRACFYRIQNIFLSELYQWTFTYRSYASKFCNLNVKNIYLFISIDANSKFRYTKIQAYQDGVDIIVF